MRLELRLQLLLGGHIEQADQYCGLIVHRILRARTHNTQPKHCLQLTSDGIKNIGLDRAFAMTL